jgi:outer membrane protein assembly factor BamB
MQRRLLVWFTAVAVSAVTMAAGCAAPVSPDASPLTGSSMLTCPDGSTDCTSPGTVRWSVPLPGSARFVIVPGTAVLNARSAITSVAGMGGPGYLANTVITAGLMVFQRGPIVEAVDLKTGHRRWSTSLPEPPQLPPSQSVVPPNEQWPLLDYLTMTAANGLIAASVDSSWVLLDARTGRLLTPRFVPKPAPPDGGGWRELLPETAHSLILVGNPFVEAVDPVTARVQWRGFAGSSVSAVIGNAVYGGSGDGRVIPSTEIVGTDLRSGQSLRPLLLPAGLQFTTVTRSEQEPDALLVTGANKIARLDPVTGRVAWTRTLPAGAIGAPLQPGPSGAAPSAEYLVPPPPGASRAIWHIYLVNLATGQTTLIPLGPAFPDAAAGITSSGLAGDGFWDFYNGAMLASVRARAQSGVSYTRLEGIDPRSGRVLWRGPWAGDVYVLGETFTGPPMIIAQSCPPSGLVAGQEASAYHQAYCDNERLYAINA